METFRMPLGFWAESDYRRSWRQAFDVLEDGQSSKSCLLVSVTDPRRSNFLMCWPLYRDSEKVYVQNAIIFLEELDGSFDLEEPWASVGPRRTVDEDGNRVSEWTTSME